MSHTPGPWGYHEFGIQLGKGRFYIDQQNGIHGIAAIIPLETASAALSPEEHEANARLIAAAPDLLAACEEMLAAIDHEYSVNPRNFPKAREAIRKAKGGGE